MSKIEPYRRLYFLYAWVEPHADASARPVWRYRVEDATTHEQHLFGELRGLLEFLQARQAVAPIGAREGEPR
jgi:hypothetical protein